MAIKMSFEENYSANAYTGDGMTTAEIAQTNNTMPEQGSGVKATGGTENVLGAWLLVAGVLIGLTLIAEKFSVGQTYAQVKIGFYNMVVITLYVVLGIALGKVFFAKFKVPGLSALFTAV